VSDFDYGPDEVAGYESAAEAALVTAATTMALKYRDGVIALAKKYEADARAALAATDTTREPVHGLCVACGSERDRAAVPPAGERQET
jgi:hypothetical protein